MLPCAAILKPIFLFLTQWTRIHSIYTAQKNKGNTQSSQCNVKSVTHSLGSQLFQVGSHNYCESVILPVVQMGPTTNGRDSINKTTATEKWFYGAITSLFPSILAHSWLGFHVPSVEGASSGSMRWYLSAKVLLQDATATVATESAGSPSTVWVSRRTSTPVKVQEDVGGH